MKRGQVTQFIIAGLIILIAVVLVLFSQSEYIKDFFDVQRSKLVGFSSKIAPVNEHIKWCMNDVAEVGAKFVLLQGGHYEPKDYIDIETFKVAYWFDAEDISPSLEIIEKEISNFVDGNLDECVLTFPDENYKIISRKPSTKTIIRDNLIIINTEYNIDVEYKNETYSLDKFSSNLDLDIIDIINNGKKIVDMEVKNDDIDILLLEDLDYKVDIFPYDDSLIYSLSDDQITLMFANKLK